MCEVHEALPAVSVPTARILQLGPQLGPPHFPRTATAGAWVHLPLSRTDRRGAPTEGPTGSPNTGRVLSYYMQAGKRGSLRLRRDGAEVEICVPPGCALYCTVELLELEHAHGINGICISVVSEVSRAMPSSATDAEITAASQQPLPFTQHLEPWAPEEFFLGPKRKWGQTGVGSTRRCAVAHLRGPKLGRGVPRKMTAEAARTAVAAMSPDQLAAAASAAGARCACHPQPPHPRRSLCRLTHPLCTHTGFHAGSKGDATRKGNHSATGSSKQQRYTASSLAAAASASATAAASAGSGTSITSCDSATSAAFAGAPPLPPSDPTRASEPTAQLPTALDPNRLLWGLCRLGCNLSSKRCSCLAYSAVKASARVSARSAEGTRLSKGAVCIEQRPDGTPKTRTFVAEFETAAALLAKYPDATLA